MSRWRRRTTRFHPLLLLALLFGWGGADALLNTLIGQCALLVAVLWLGWDGRSKSGAPATPVWSWWWVMILAIYTGIGALFGTGQGTLLWKGPHIPGVGTLLITTGSLWSSAMRGLRLWNLLLLFGLVSRWSRPEDVTAWLGRSFSRTALTLSMVLRFLPNLLEERRRIVQWTRMRGGLRKGTALRLRLRGQAVVLQTLLMNALERSWAVAEAMFTRGYGSTGRTRYGQVRWRTADSLVLTGLTVGIVLVLCPYADATLIKTVPLLGVCVLTGTAAVMRRKLGAPAGD